MESRVNCAKIGYCFLALSAILILFVIKSYRMDMEQTSWNNAKEVLVEDNQLATGYLDNLFANRIAALELISRNLAEVNLEDKTQILQKVQLDKNFFDDVSVVEKNGKRLYGKCVNTSITEEEGFKSAVRGSSIIADNITTSYDGKPEIRIYVPVCNKSGSTVAIMVASLLGERISRYIQNVSQNTDKCVSVMTNRGILFAGTKNMSDVIGKAGSSYFSYLKSTNVIEPQEEIYTMRGDMTMRKKMYIEYNISKEKYIASCLPSKKSSLYIMTMSLGNGSGFYKKTISSSCEKLLMVFVADIIALFVVLIYHLRKLNKMNNILKSYGLINEIDSSVLFEYDFNPKCMIIYGKVGKDFNKKRNVLTGESVYDVYDCVHKDDSSIRGRLHKFFESTEEIFSAEMRIDEGEGQYGWYRLKGVMLRDAGQNPVRFVGKISNANNQISMEKSLVERAENDLLTGVLNKKTIEGKITDMFENEEEGKNYIFYMVDLDNFKNVNDTLGHIYGDRAIADTAKLLEDIFHGDALVGRLGGDEFAVFAAYSAFDEESLKSYIIKMAEKICEANRRSYSDGDAIVEISSSVGISVAPRDGRNFETLYQKADSALYNSKKSGKDRYTIFKMK